MNVYLVLLQTDYCELCLLQKVIVESLVLIRIEHTSQDILLADFFSHCFAKFVEQILWTCTQALQIHMIINLQLDFHLTIFRNKVRFEWILLENKSIPTLSLWLKFRWPTFRRRIRNFINWDFVLFWSTQILDFLRKSFDWLLFSRRSRFSLDFWFWYIWYSNRLRSHFGYSRSYWINFCWWFLVGRTFHLITFFIW